MKKRYPGFDYMRGIGSIIIILSHSNSFGIINQVGWISLESFFVLSGFLVSGLLFMEFKNTGEVRPGRFFLRRGFKIYPLFYLVLIGHILYFWIKNTPPDLEQILAEVFFYQNYEPGVMVVSWSLALEEHFYLLLLLIMVFVTRANKIVNSEFIPRICIFIMLCCLILRSLTFINSGYVDELTNIYSSHLRMDSLAFGVFISYYYHFRRASFSQFIRSYKHLIGIAGIFFILPVFFYTIRDPFILTIGFSLVYLAFGILIVLLLLHKDSLKKNGQPEGKFTKYFSPFAFIGRCSYAIYLVHFLVGPAVANFVRENIYPDMPVEVYAIIYTASGVILGIVLTLTIEKPLLAFRDRRFPQPGTSV